jgi:hypothetical protein
MIEKEVVPAVITECDDGLVDDPSTLRRIRKYSPLIVQMRNCVANLFPIECSWLRRCRRGDGHNPVEVG